MTDVLPRQTFKTAAHAAVECAVADYVAQWAKAKWLKIGTDDPDRQKPRVDGLFYRDRVVAFAEIKSCSRPFRNPPEGWTTGRKKVLTLQDLFKIVRVPVIILVRFGCATVAYIDSDEIHEVIYPWGRGDRNSLGDIEDGARFPWSAMHVVGHCEVVS